MGIRVEQVDIPGIGVRHDLITEGGRRIGVVSRHSGERELVVFDQVDPDACTELVTLTDDEAGALAEFLAASLMLSKLAGLAEQAAGLHTEQLWLPADSPYVGRKLRQTGARSRTGVSIVAVLREGVVLASPGPELPLAAGDVLVAVGTRSGLDALTRLLADG